MDTTFLIVKSAEAFLVVSMVEDAHNAKSAEAFLFVNVGEYALHAMGENALDVKSVETVLFLTWKNTF